MSEIHVKDGESIDSALKRFKRSCAKAGVIAEVRKREHYESPSVKRRKKSEAARKNKKRYLLICHRKSAVPMRHSTFYCPLARETAWEQRDPAPPDTSGRRRRSPWSPPVRSFCRKGCPASSKRTKWRLAVPGIGEIPGAQVLGEENGRGLPVQQILEFLAGAEGAPSPL